MKTSTKLLPILSIALLVGCSNMNHTEQNALAGTAIGAGAGAIVGALVNSSNAVGWGALIGAGVGLVGGLIYDSAVYDGY